ncbi:hypothetical protein BX070DRAFT_61904 [Coemansia spiralis]|nr:hypothetical protein BX070DRAFT_61904 [Coemansia spiralis]
MVACMVVALSWTIAMVADTVEATQGCFHLAVAAKTVLCRREMAVPAVAHHARVLCLRRSPNHTGSLCYLAHCRLVTQPACAFARFASAGSTHIAPLSPLVSRRMRYMVQCWPFLDLKDKFEDKSKIKTTNISKRKGLLLFLFPPLRSFQIRGEKRTLPQPLRQDK